MRFPHVFVAGTFDGLHKGHRIFLSEAFKKGERITIGLTSDEFLKKFKMKNGTVPIKNFEERKKDLEEWLYGQGYKKRVTIVAIADPYEPAASTPHGGALMVTKDNKRRGEEINAMRKRRGLSLLSLVEVPLVSAEDLRPISSTRIRNGEIDTLGRLVLPDSLREELQQPLGLVLTGEDIKDSLEEHRGGIIIAVGDIATKTLIDLGAIPNLSIIDNMVGRKSFTEAAKKLKMLNVAITTTQSGPGYISKEALFAIQKILVSRNGAHALIIRGEEDLLTLPAVAYAPTGSVVYYGQPPIPAWACGPIVEGLVEVGVTKEKKKEALWLLGRFISP